jgi:nucleoside 2-deoxyribosyltransferase
MNLYFACSLTGGRDYEGVYGRIVDFLLSEGHVVPTEHLARPEVMALERVVDPREVFTRDIDWIENCDALIAEVSTPSHGVGFEIAYALSREKPVLCCHSREVAVSKMLTGNFSPHLQVAAYDDEEDVLRVLSAFLRRIDRVKN